MIPFAEETGRVVGADGDKWICQVFVIDGSCISRG